VDQLADVGPTVGCDPFGLVVGDDESDEEEEAEEDDSTDEDRVGGDDAITSEEGGKPEGFPVLIAGEEVVLYGVNELPDFWPAEAEAEAEAETEARGDALDEEASAAKVDSC
jgi:hypothetical protein